MLLPVTELVKSRTLPKRQDTLSPTALAMREEDLGCSEEEFGPTSESEQERTLNPSLMSDSVMNIQV